VKITFAAPDRIRRDLDNLHGAMKASLDGIAKALGVDDSRFVPVTLDRVLDKQKQGFVIVEIGGQP
jgi:Holliday junction resolvase RusA-like endonuclease